MIWIDAICINQDDLDEKGLQVQLMAEIYARASCVIVWLENVTGDCLIDGESQAGGFQALRMLEAAASRHEAVLEDKQDWLAVEKLLGRPWFRRIWVLQEVAAARHILIMCKFAEIDGQVFCSGLEKMSKNLLLTDEDARSRIRSTVSLMKGATLRPKGVVNAPEQLSLQISPLGYLIEMHHIRDATDRRDKIYALLGMSTNKPTGLVPNYQMSWKDLFPHLVKSILPEYSSVATIDAHETALIKIRGCVIGTVNDVRREDTWYGQQTVTIIPHKSGPHDGDKHFTRLDWSLQATTKRIHSGDIVCLLQGTSLPTIIRAHQDYCSIVTIAVDTGADIISLIESWHRNTKLEFLLDWSWKAETQPSTFNDFLKARGLSSTSCIPLQIPDDLNTALMLLETGQNYSAILKVHPFIVASEDVDEKGYPNAVAAARFLDVAQTAVEIESKRTKGFGMLKYLIGKRRGSVKMTEDFLIELASARGWEPMAFLLATQGKPITITEKILLAAMKNHLDSGKIMKLLLGGREDQINVSGKCIEEAIADPHDRTGVATLLNYRAAQISITEDALIALARSPDDASAWPSDSMTLHQRKESAETLVNAEAKHSVNEVDMENSEPAARVLPFEALNTAKSVLKDPVADRLEDASTNTKPEDAIQLLGPGNRGDEQPDASPEEPYDGESRDTDDSDGVQFHAPTDRTLWTPPWLRKLSLLAFFGLFTALWVALIVLWKYDVANSGFVIYPKATPFSWTYSPTAVLVLITGLWRQVDYHAKINQPWQQMAKGPTAAANSVLLDYISPSLPMGLFKALRNRHWTVATTATGFAILKLMTVISTALLVPVATEVTGTVPVQINSTFDSSAFWRSTKSTFNTTNHYPEIKDPFFTNISSSSAIKYLQILQGKISDPIGTQQGIAFQDAFAQHSPNILKVNSYSVVVNTFVPNVSCVEVPHKVLDHEEGKIQADIPACGAVKVRIKICSEDGFAACNYLTTYNMYRVFCFNSTGIVSRQKEVRFLLIASVMFREPPPGQLWGGKAIMSQTTAISCKVTYNMGKANRTSNVENARTSPDISILSSSGEKLVNLTDQGLTEILYSILVAADADVDGPVRETDNLMDVGREPNWGNETVGSRTIFGLMSQTSHGRTIGYDEFFDGKLMAMSATTALAQLSVLFVQEAFVVIDNTVISAPSTFVQERLRFKEVSLWLMVAGLLMLSLLTVGTLFTFSPAVSQDPSLLGSHAAILSQIEVQLKFKSTIGQNGNIDLRRSKFTSAPVVLESTAVNLTDADTSLEGFNYHIQPHFDLNLTNRVPEDAADPFFRYIMSGSSDIGLSKLGSDNKLLSAAVNTLYSDFMVQVIDSQIFRQPDQSSQKALIKGTMETQVTRLFINRTAKIILQSFLGSMIALGLTAFFLVDLKGTLPRSPHSIASIMALFAGSDLCANHIPEGAVWMNKQQLDQLFEGYLFSLGWWKRNVEEADSQDNDDETRASSIEERFGIDIGTPERKGFGTKGQDTD
ncbi:hypothetical protein CcaCcLH18_07322 [Colletotrichum camelliae]|nr:hypothetical protein CcaCcLH18_07322 [Colletotrichum camelliae]